MLRVVSPICGGHFPIARRCLAAAASSSSSSSSSRCSVTVGTQSHSGEFPSSFSLNSPHCWFTTTTRKRRFKSTAAVGEGMDNNLNNNPNHPLFEHQGKITNTTSPTTTILSEASKEIHRLKHLRNVGILAHVDAGKTTVTERMLALAGVVRSAGSVDSGNTVTDYLPAERERGITIQSAAVSFDWGWHNNPRGNDYEANDNVKVQLIDTPGHVDFSVEVNRSVAVLDGAVLVVDAVAGVQAQTETVWRALTQPSWNNHEVQPRIDTIPPHQSHAHEPLPCLALINKMDKDGCHFGKAIESLKHKLPGANPIPIQLPLFRTTTKNGGSSSASQKEGNKNSDTTTITGTTTTKRLSSSIVAVSPDDVTTALGEFVGVVDLIHMRAVVWPEHMNAATASRNGGLSNVENCIPTIIPLLKPQGHDPIHSDCTVTQKAIAARCDFIEALAEVDPSTEEYYLNDEEPSNAELRAGLRRATLSQQALPVMAGAALRGLGVEPLLDSIADLLPSPLDRLPPALTRLDREKDDSLWKNKKKSKKKNSKAGPITDPTSSSGNSENTNKVVTLGHPLHPSLLALAFKVVHMKGRGGSGDGRVVFARVYSGTLKDRDVVKVVSPPAPGEVSAKPRVERVGGMLELSGGRFDNVEDGMCKSGEVCALVGLKGVVTGDTIYLAPSSNEKKDSSSKKGGVVCLAGVASPKPVLTVRLEVATSDQQARLSEALALMAIEDPSLKVEETDSATLLSGLGELHIEVTLDRLHREYGLELMTGPPAVTYRETITDPIESNGLVNYDRTIGGTRLQAAVRLVLEPNLCQQSVETGSSCMLLSEPIVTIGPKVREYLCLDPDLPEEDLIHRSDAAKALIQGCQGALKRGPVRSCAMANIRCHVEEIDSEGGFAVLHSLPGAIRASVAQAVTQTLKEGDKLGHCTALEPTMSVEVTLPADMVGTVLSDITGRRGTVGDVLTGDGNNNESSHIKALVRGDVPLVEILGYANSLRSLTGGEGAFSAEYKGHSPC